MGLSYVRMGAYLSAADSREIIKKSRKSSQKNQKLRGYLMTVLMKSEMTTLEIIVTDVKSCGFPITYAYRARVGHLGPVCTCALYVSLYT